jgi:hypothetical protein
MEVPRRPSAAARAAAAAGAPTPPLSHRKTSHTAPMAAEPLAPRPPQPPQELPRRTFPIAGAPSHPFPRSPRGRRTPSTFPSAPPVTAGSLCSPVTVVGSSHAALAPMNLKVASAGLRTVQPQHPLLQRAQAGDRRLALEPRQP